MRSFLSGVVGGFVGVVVALIWVTYHPAALQRVLHVSSLTNPVAPATTFTPADQREAAVIDVVKKATPAVVSIVITKDVPILERSFDNFFGDPFSSPFGFPMPHMQQRGTQKQEIGGGSGFIVSSDGLIITNRHVVSQADAEYTVFTNDGKKYDATVVARDPVQDLAVLRIKTSNLPFLQFASSDALQVGQSVIAIGNALGEFQNTVSVGVVSGLARSITAGDGQGASEQLSNVIQTDAAINPGNSGGPLLDLHGTVIGVNVAVAQGSENVGFALPGNLARSVVESVQKTGKIVRPFIGVRYIPVTPALKEKNNLSVDYGVLVSRGETVEDLAVVPNSPAAKAGIVEGDIILEADGKKLTNETSLSSLIAAKNVGERVSLKILHHGQEKMVEVTLDEVPQ